MKNDFENSSKSLNTNVSEVLGKYGYALDSTKKVLIKLAAQPSKTIIEGAAPTVELGNGTTKGLLFVEHKNNYYKYALTVFSKDAGSSRFQIVRSETVADSNNNYYYTGHDELMPYEFRLSKDEGKQVDYFVNSNAAFRYLYMWVRGNIKTPITQNPMTLMNYISLI
jgi:hypothetical protein